MTTVASSTSPNSLKAAASDSFVVLQLMPRTKSLRFTCEAEDRGRMRQTSAPRREQGAHGRDTIWTRCTDHIVTRHSDNVSIRGWNVRPTALIRRRMHHPRNTPRRRTIKTQVACRTPGCQITTAEVPHAQAHTPYPNHTSQKFGIARRTPDDPVQDPECAYQVQSQYQNTRHTIRNKAHEETQIQTRIGQDT